MSEIAKAYVQLVPSAKGFKSGITSVIGGDVSSAGSDAGNNFGSAMVSTLKKVVVAAGIGKIVKDALDFGGDLQQSFGGLETIYGDAAEAAKNYAREAAAAGIAMNDYAEQAVSFGASLKQAFGDDVEGAVDAANQAILDMADNSAKMGTDIESIQNAYQGFAKQNYTMLDNLKLGYGGTKEEMERLLAHAEELSGIHYDIDNLGDVYQAIHVVQEELGLTGVAADEAKTTLTGSLGAMKAAWENLLAAATTGEDIGAYIDTFAETATTFLIENLIPMLGSLASALIAHGGELVEAALQVVYQILDEIGNALSEQFPALAGIFEYLPEIIAAIAAALGILKIATLAMAAAQLVANAAFLPIIAIILAIIAVVTLIVEAVMHWGEIVDWLKGKWEVVTDFFAGIWSGITGLFEGIGSWFGEKFEAAKNAVQNAWANVTGFFSGIWSGITTTFSNVGSWFNDKFTTAKNNVHNAWSNTKTFFSNIWSGISSTFSNVGSWFKDKFSTAYTNVTSAWANAKTFFSNKKDEILGCFSDIGDKFMDVGSNIISGIKNGIDAGWSWLSDTVGNLASSLLDSAKSALGIASPSREFRDQVGKWIPAGIAVGVNMNAASAEDAINDLTSDMLSTSQLGVASMLDGFEGQQGNFNQTLYITTTDNSADEIARKVKIETKYGLMIGGALG